MIEEQKIVKKVLKETQDKKPSKKKKRVDYGNVGWGLNGLGELMWLVVVASWKVDMALS